MASDLEETFAFWWRVLAPTDAPQPEREVCLIPGRKFRCDFVWRDRRTVVEVDGGTYKALGGRHNTDKDREKMNLLALHGFKVLRYSGSMLRNDPEGVIRQVLAAVWGVKA